MIFISTHDVIFNKTLVLMHNFFFFFFFFFFQFIKFFSFYYKKCDITLIDHIILYKFPKIFY